MKSFQKIVAATAVVAMMGMGSAHAERYASTTGGCGYNECRTAPCLAPAIALGTIALIAIIAVAVSNSGSGSGSHSHSHNN